MPLSQEQRARLLETLGPIIQEALVKGVKPIIQEEVGRVLAEAKDEGRSYSDRILSGPDQRKLREQTDNGFGVARIARCIALAHNDPDRAARLAKDLYDDDLGDIVQKVLSSGPADEGGVFVPSELADSFIDALRARAVVRQAGPIEIDLTSGNLRVPRITTDPTAGWVGEGKRRKASNLRTGSLVFTAKTIQGKSSLTQKLLRRSGQNAEQIVRNGLVRVMANEEDTTFLSGTGSEFKPKGMLNWAIAANKFNSNATINLTNVQNDLRTQMSKLTDASVDIDMAQWFMSWRTRNFLAFSLRDTEDQPAFKGEMTADTPTLNGQRVWVTNNIPNNLGGGNDESRIYFTAMNEAWLAEESGLVVKASTEASFEDDTGTTISAFDHGLMVIIIERDLDFAMAHGEAVAVMEQVKYGS